MKYIKGLDALRALAVMAVLISHSRINLFYMSAGPFAKIVQVLLPGGGFGVDVFFVLSGFLITSILLHAQTGDLPKLILVRNFIIRRALRIFPVYYATLFILWFLYPEIHSSMPWFLTYTSNILVYKTHFWNAFSHTWTLSVEEQFYLLWPWLMVFVNRKYFNFLFIAFIVCGPLSSFIGYKFWNAFNPVLTPNCFDSFGIGGLYAYCLMNPVRREKFKKTLTVAFPMAVCIYLYWQISAAAGHGDRFDEVFQRPIHSIIAIWLIDYIVHHRSPFWENSILNGIGKISYGIYLFHIPVSMIINSMQIPAPSFIIYAIKISTLLLLSYVSYYFFETKVMALKKNFSYHSAL